MLSHVQSKLNKRVVSASSELGLGKEHTAKRKKSDGDEIEAGSVVWARLPPFAVWWPAWIEMKSGAFYRVIFFDDSCCLQALMNRQELKIFTGQEDKIDGEVCADDVNLSEPLGRAVRQARAALTRSATERALSAAAHSVQDRQGSQVTALPSGSLPPALDRTGDELDPFHGVPLRLVQNTPCPPQEPIPHGPPQEPIPACPPQEPIPACPLQEPIPACPPQEPIPACPPQEPIPACPPQEPIPACPPQEPIPACPPQEPIPACPPQEPILACPPQEPIPGVAGEEQVETPVADGHGSTDVIQTAVTLPEAAGSAPRGDAGNQPGGAVQPSSPPDAAAAAAAAAMLSSEVGGGGGGGEEAVVPDADEQVCPARGGVEYDAVVPCSELFDDLLFASEYDGFSASDSFPFGNEE